MSIGKHAEVTIELESSSTPPSAKAVPDRAAIYGQLERILSDPLFSNRRRYASLLRFIVDRTLDGQHDSLKERIIGIEVFGRTADYDTGADASVRIAIAELRKRLMLYYKEHGHEHELRIELPMRSYVAEFTFPERLVEEPSVPVPIERRNPVVGIAAIGAMVLLVSALAIWGIHRLQTPASAIDAFWRPIFKASGPVSISVSSSALGDSQAAPLSEDQNSSGSGMSFSKLIDKEPEFPMAVLSTATSIASFLGTHNRVSVLRRAQTLPISELRNGPAVILGSVGNDWEILLGSGLRYRPHYDPSGRTNWIEDTKDANKRKFQVNMSAPYEQTTKDYTLITRAFDETNAQWWICISSLTGFSMVTAESVLTDPGSMVMIGKRLPKGWENKNLQIVLETNLVKGKSGTSTAVAAYSW